MGSMIKVNDTLQISTAQGFPAALLDIEVHRASPIVFSAVEGMLFSFSGKEGARLYHPAPTRCFLVQNIGGKWLYWGKVIIVEQTIRGEGELSTSGKFRIIELYDPLYQELLTRRECPEGKSYFS